MVAGLRSETERLRAERRLVQEALASGAGGEQRKVQRVLLRHTSAELALAERASHAVDAGWEPFEPSAGWCWGYVEDPRFLNGRTRLASVVLALPPAVFGGWLLLTRWEPLPAVAGLLVLLLGLPVALEGVLGCIGRDRDTRRLRHAPAAPSHARTPGSTASRTGGAQQPTTELRIFNAPMPAHALVAYRRAKASGLFDTFVVHSPRWEDFRKADVSEAPSLGLLDPVLAGRIGRHSFLIAQWDLARVLADGAPGSPPAQDSV